jgi:fluoroquinolone transport system permease protein
MSRMAAAVRIDVALQARNNLYAIGIALAVVLGAVGRYVFPDEVRPIVVPSFYLLFIGGSTYMFVAAMILFERAEGTLAAIRVSPLRLDEYLASKVVTLTTFALAESLIVLLIAFGAGGFHIVPLVVGVLALGAFNTLVGIAQVARHRTVTDFLIPGAMLVMLILQLPIFHFLGMWTGPVWYLIPTRAPLLIIEGAFRPLTGPEWGYAIAYSAVWLLGAARLARSQFVRHLVMGGRET